MNELLHIKKDEEVNSIESATIEDVLGFLDGGTGQRVVDRHAVGSSKQG